MTTTAQLYRHFIKEHELPFCWLCGRDASERPQWWNAAWLLHRAHIVASPRVEDVRLIWIGCPWCHAVSEGIRFAGAERPKILRANLLWLKRERDLENFDLEFLQRFSVQRLPRAVAPHSVYLSEYQGRHG